MSNQGKKLKIFDERFEVLSIIGRGECSVVYKARHISAPYTEVALKVLVDKNSQDSTLEKLRREALAMVSCRHKYVIRLDDFRSFNNLSYICMEYAPYRDLRYYTNKRGGRLDVDQAINFLNQILEALSFIHESGIIHRDIKPDNILVLNDSEIRLGDFGLTLLPTEEPSPTDLKIGIGTTDYLAPEVLQAKTYNASSDVYSLATSFYELISGVNPFNNVVPSKLLDARNDSNITPLNEITNDVPEYLANVIKKAMSFDFNDRYQNATEMLRDLQMLETTESSIQDDLENNTLGSPLILTQSLVNKTSQVRSVDSIISGEGRPTLKNIDNRPFLSDQGGDSNYYQDESTSSTNTINDYDSKNYSNEPLYLENENNTIMADENYKIDNLEPYLGNRPEKSKTFKASDYSNDTIYSTSELLSKPDPNSDQQTLNESISESKDLRSSNIFDFYTGKNPPSSRTLFSKLHSLEKLSISQDNIFKKILPISILAIALLVLIILFFFLFDKSENESINYEYTNLPVVYDVDNEFTFPHLPNGTYFGKINGLFPNISLPLTFISNEKEGTITILIGIDGWKPINIDVKNSSSHNQKLYLKGNGFILRLISESTSTEDVISGYFENIISMESGKWQVRALK